LGQSYHAQNARFPVSVVVSRCGRQAAAKQRAPIMAQSPGNYAVDEETRGSEAKRIGKLNYTVVASATSGDKKPTCPPANLSTRKWQQQQQQKQKRQHQRQ